MNDDTPAAPDQPASPFRNIALSLSGGGVRAAGFHVGTLSYLDRTGLLPNVHILSSVSGGSLVALGYALSQKKGFDFAKYRPKLAIIEDRFVFLSRHRFMARRGFELVKRTAFNNWYVPKGTPFPYRTLRERLWIFKKMYLGLLPRKVKEARKMKHLGPFREL